MEPRLCGPSGILLKRSNAEGGGSPSASVFIFGKDASVQRTPDAGSRMLKAKVSMFAAMQSQANRDLREQLQHQRLITLDYILGKGAQSNWRGKQARICVLSCCAMRSAHTQRCQEPKACTSPATALYFPQNKQPQRQHAANQYMSVQRAGTDGGGRRRGRAAVHNSAPPLPLFALD